VIKLDHNCDKMIEVMKTCHQELEVTDMTAVKPVRQSISYSTSTRSTSSLSMRECSDAAPERRSKKSRGMMVSSAAMDYESESRDYFRSEAVKGLSMQVMSK